MVEFKGPVKIISFADMILSCIMALSLGIFVLVFTLIFPYAVANTYTADTTGDTTLIQESPSTLILTLSWFIIVIMLMATVVKIRAAYKLHFSCKIDTDPKDSYLLCKSWRDINLIFLSVNIATCFLGYRRLSLLAIILYIVPICVAHGYMRELLAIKESRRTQSVITGEGNPGIKSNGPPNVSVAFPPVASCP